MKSFLIAFQFLTGFHVRQIADVTPKAIGESAVFFPVVGLLLGVILVSCNELLVNLLPPPILSIGLVLQMVLMTRAFHLDGLADTFDGLGAKGGQEEALKAMQDSATGVFGLLAVLTILSLKFASLDILHHSRVHALLLAPALGRWAMIVLAYNASSPREGLGRIVVEHMKRRQFLLASLIAVTISGMVAGARGLWLALSVLALSRAMKIYFDRRLGGITGDTCGAIGEIAETLGLLFFALVEWQEQK